MKSSRKRSNSNHVLEQSKRAREMQFALDNENGLVKDADAAIWTSITTDTLDIKALFQYIRSGANLNICNRDGYGLLYLATRNENMEALRMLLLTSKMDVNLTHGPHHELPIHVAASNGQADAIDLLIEYGSDIHRADGLGHTPLSNSLFSKSLVSVELLIKEGAKTDVIDAEGNTLLHLAVTNNFPGVIPLLVKREGIDVDQKNKHGLAPLALAISQGYNEVMRCLLDNGANVNAMARGHTTLHHAVHWNRLEAVQELVKRGCKVNVYNTMDETPLLLAVQQRKIDMVHFLVQNGADPCYVPEEGGVAINRPLLYAANHGYTQLCNLLITESTPPFFLRSAAQLAERAGHFGTAQHLLQKLEGHTPATATAATFPEAVPQTLHETAENAKASPYTLEADEFNALINASSDDEPSDLLSTASSSMV